jgi:hypothetical protein
MITERATDEGKNEGKLPYQGNFPINPDGSIANLPSEGIYRFLKATPPNSYPGYSDK